MNKFKSKLFQDPSLAGVDVFVQDSRVVEDVRKAIAVGLTPGAFSLIGDAVVLRLERNESRKPLQEE